MITQITINNFSLSPNGLAINFTKAGVTINSSYDPFATCDLFQSLGIIEGFEKDSNGEPVILYTDNSYGRPAPAFTFWHVFARSFGFIKRHAEIIIEHKEDTRNFRTQRRRINKLLKSQKAA